MLRTFIIKVSVLGYFPYRVDDMQIMTYMQSKIKKYYKI